MSESQRFGKSLSFILFLALVFGNPSIFALADEHGPPGGGWTIPEWGILVPDSNCFFPPNLGNLGVSGIGEALIPGIVEARDNSNKFVSSGSFTVLANQTFSTNLPKPEGENWPVTVGLKILIDDDGDGKKDDQVGTGITIHFNG